MRTANELRRMFLEYFVKQGHTEVASSPIVPPDDPTMLFTTAGMVQFKSLYAGLVSPLPYSRATTCQKCLRAGGKASDLENVGKTLRHFTFFEMLGNFSFGDYFKRDAIRWAWELCTGKDWMGLPAGRMFATVFGKVDKNGEWVVDDEAEGFWKNETDGTNGLVRLDEKENFWGPAGETGACGPCSEIKFFMGSDGELAEYQRLARSSDPRDQARLAHDVVEKGDLFLEIWNLVFPQFDQQKDGSRPLLKNRGIDTGAGLERMTTAMQFVESGGKIQTPYDSDLLRPIVEEAARLLGVDYYADDEPERERDPRKRHWVNGVTDHARALTFALSEGLVPSNEGRGYVLRRILRRALRFAYLMDVTEPFLYKLVEPVVAVMGGTYPELETQPDHVARIIRIEEERFLRTVKQGSLILDERIAQARDAGGTTFPGEDAFLLHATYGFPVDMTAEIAEEAGLVLDREGFGAAMKGHQAEARKSWKGAGGSGAADLFGDVWDQNGETVFRGYETTECETSVLAIAVAGARAAMAEEGSDAIVVLEESPFYAESGGQVGDTGVIESEDGALVTVSDTRKTPSGLVLHHGRVTRGTLRAGDGVVARVDAARRLATMRNHTVTHLLQAGLKKVLGPHVTQSGSYVGPEAMRFDFAHTQAVTQEELRQVERFVNERILEDHPLTIEELPLAEARKRGAIAPFGEKYGHVVRVVQIGGRQGVVGIEGNPVSLEFCGGTHMDRVGRIGSFRLLTESSVAAGIRRIEGTTGLGAYESWAATRNVTADLCRTLAIREEQIGERLEALQEEIRKLRKDVKAARQAGAAGPGGASADSLIAGATLAGAVKVVVARVEGADTETLRALCDQVRDKAGAAVVVLGAENEGKALLICAVTKEETKRVKAGDIIKKIAPVVGGGGGGRPDLAQAGGKDPAKLDEALALAREIVAGLLA